MDKRYYIQYANSWSEPYLTLSAAVADAMKLGIPFVVYLSGVTKVVEVDVARVSYSPESGLKYYLEEK